jgi:hypothetical protein
MALAGAPNSYEEINSPAWSSQQGRSLHMPEDSLAIPVDFHDIQGSRQSIFHPPRS